MRRRWMVVAALQLPGVELIPKFYDEAHRWTRAGAERTARRWSRTGRLPAASQFAGFRCHGYGFCHETELAAANRRILDFANRRGERPWTEAP